MTDRGPGQSIELARIRVAREIQTVAIEHIHSSAG
jgi:hypothetical protein